jgi:hypothetical protein
VGRLSSEPGRVLNELGIAISLINGADTNGAQKAEAIYKELGGPFRRSTVRSWKFG